MKLVGRVSRDSLRDGALVRIAYPPFDVLVAEVDGRPYAIEDACNHAGASLAEGTLRSGCVSCPMHGYLFDVRTGKLVRPRGLCADQRTYVTEIQGDEVLVWDAAQVTISHGE
jgi:nitrite reductase/ring-hydroxylating ferredoxin subunit